MEHYLRESQRTVSDRIRELRLRMERELGGMSRVTNNALGPLLLFTARRESRKYAAGRPLEPRTFVDRANYARS